jgi:hypothetical protein
VLTTSIGKGDQTINSLHVGMEWFPKSLLHPKATSRAGRPALRLRANGHGEGSPQLPQYGRRRIEAKTCQLAHIWARSGCARSTVMIDFRPETKTPARVNKKKGKIVIIIGVYFDYNLQALTCVTTTTISGACSGVSPYLHRQCHLV